MNVYYECNREMHKMLWKDGAEAIESDFRRTLWLLCMSRKTESKGSKSRKSIEATLGATVEVNEGSNLTDHDINEVCSATAATGGGVSK